MAIVSFSAEGCLIGDAGSRQWLRDTRSLLTCNETPRRYRLQGDTHHMAFAVNEGLYGSG